MRYSTIMIGLLLLSLSSCSETQETTSKTISWFQGDVTAAFSHAKAESKPLFLYWGAVWCPPCQEIKHTVFKSRGFIEQTDSFIAVYLDGDTEAAQAAGEQFGVKGYPTMIVFSSAGIEITRLPGGIDISRYNDILASALNSITPTRDLVIAITRDPTSLTEPQLKQLAYYSWGQDNEALPKDYSPELFLSASSLATDKVSASRLFMQYLYDVSSRLQEDDKPQVIKGARGKLNDILASRALVLANWDSLAYSAKALAPLAAAGDDLEALKKTWQQATLDAMDDTSLSAAEQLAGLIPALVFYFEVESNTALPDDLKARVLVATEKADSATQNSFARQSVVNQINGVLQEARLFDEAKTLLHAELDRSSSPYYFMSSLAAIAEKEEDFTSALAWRQKAYDTSEGSATRFQWGANYVRALIRMTPHDETKITSAAISLLGEMTTDHELFAGRNFRVLRSLNANLHKWQESRASNQLASSDDALKQRCNDLDDDSTAMKNCRSLPVSET